MPLWLQALWYNLTNIHVCVRLCFAAITDLNSDLVRKSNRTFTNNTGYGDNVFGLLIFPAALFPGFPFPRDLVPGNTGIPGNDRIPLCVTMLDG